MDKRWAGVLRLIGIGWYVAACILLGTLGGRWVGQKVGSNNSEVLFTVLGLILGLIVAFLGVYRMVKSTLTNDKDKGNS
jgi:uncharacterized protein YacL